MEKLFARCYTICEHKVRCCVCNVPWEKKEFCTVLKSKLALTAIYNILLPMFVIAATQLQNHFKQLPFSLAPSVPVSNTLITQQIVFFLYFPRWNLFGNYRNPLQNHFKLELPFSLAPPRSRFKLAHLVHLCGILLFVFSVTAEMIYHPGSLQTCN